jgi:predicted enzyme related to lactoylglutathione lyase
MPSVSVRYIVDDVARALDFYTGQHGGEEVMDPAPTLPRLRRGALRYVLSAPGGGPGGGASMPDGSVPTPGGWNRIQIEVDDLDASVGRLRDAGAAFRNEVVEGVGGRQAIVEDPAGNPIELFQPTNDKARLSG